MQVSQNFRHFHHIQNWGKLQELLMNSLEYCKIYYGKSFSIQQSSAGFSVACTTKHDQKLLNNLGKSAWQNRGSHRKFRDESLLCFCHRKIEKPLVPFSAHIGYRQDPTRQRGNILVNTAQSMIIWIHVGRHQLNSQVTQPQSANENLQAIIQSYKSLIRNPRFLTPHIPWLRSEAHNCHRMHKTNPFG